MLIFIFIVCGIISLILGILAIFFSGLPSTPFLLLALMSFIQSSPKLHRWLLNSRYGDHLRKYEQNPGLHLRTKLYIIFLIAVICGISIIFFIPSGIFEILVGVAGLVGCAVVLFFIPRLNG